MAWVEMCFKAPDKYDNPESIKDLDDQLTRKDLTDESKKWVLVCFWRHIFTGKPVRQYDGTWSLRVIHADLVRFRLRWVVSVLSQLGFVIESARYYQCPIFLNKKNS